MSHASNSSTVGRHCRLSTDDCVSADLTAITKIGHKGVHLMTSVDRGASAVVPIECADWSAEPAAQMRSAALPALEAGDVLFFPTLRFEVEPDEAHAFSPAIAGSSKNVAF